MSSLFDERLDYVSHSGVKGMKWGIRKKVYERQTSSAAKARKDAEELRVAAEALGSGKAGKKTADALRKSADALEGFDDAGAKAQRKLADDISSGKALSKSERAQAKALLEGAKGLERQAKAFDAAAAKNKTKMDALKKEMSLEQSKRDAKRNEKVASNGREFVNLMFTGNKEGRITKGVALQYLVAAGAIGYMLSTGGTRSNTNVET